MQRVAILKPSDLDAISDELAVTLNKLILDNWDQSQGCAQFSRAEVEDAMKQLYKKSCGENVEFMCTNVTLNVLRAVGWTVDFYKNEDIIVSK